MKKLFKRLIKLLFGVFLFTLLIVFSLGYINPPVWMWKVQRYLNPPENYPAKVLHSWVPRDKISPSVQLAVIAAEDQHFPTHWGFDFNSILQAIESSQQGKPLRGASTLTQQTAKNLFLWPGRNFLRKGIEAYFTAVIEFFWSKGRILEVYLNIVEFGPGIYGVEAASQYYFNKQSINLTDSEAALLAAVLPNPYQFNVKRTSAYMQKRVRWIKKQMRQLGRKTLDRIK
jgi:monofunctional biosynthetic peptidoglycan transglycosylase